MTKIYSSLLFLSMIISLNSLSQTMRQVSATNFVFSPVNFSASVGDTIRFTFGNPTTPGGFPHTTTSLGIPAGADPWDSPLTAANTVFDYVIKVPGTYNYKCTPHEGRGMLGQFLVSATAPVKLTRFSAAYADSKAQLSWQTASEENSDHFSVEQSSNGTDFSEIGTVAAAGSSNSIKNYIFQVVSVPAGAAFLYFRLLTVDKDKKQQYSDIILLHLPGSTNTTFMKAIYPNPAGNGDHLHFSFTAERSDKLSVTIFETSGRNIFNMPLTAVEGVNETHMPLPKMRRGNYFVQFILGDKKQTMPLIIK